MLTRTAPLFLLLLGALILPACTGTVSTQDGSSQTGTQVYPFTEDDAVLVMRNAMEKEFESDQISTVLTPYRGFQGKIRFIADVDTITVYAVPATGQGPEGQQIDGFAFEVKHSGTYPLGGVPKSRAVLAGAVASADRLVKSLPHAN
jgi:hypothetical protein